MLLVSLIAFRRPPYNTSCLGSSSEIRTNAELIFRLTDAKTKRDLLGSLTGGGGKPASDDQAMYQGQVTTGLTGLGLAPVTGPANTVLGTVNGLESGVQGTLNGLGLGAVNGVAKGVLGALNGVEDQVGSAVKGLGLPEPLGSTVGNVITTAKGVQGQTLSNLNVQLPVDPSTAAGSLQNPNALGLGGVLGSVGGLEGQLNGLGLGSLGGTANGLLGTAASLPGQLGGSGLGGALGGLTGQLNGLGLGSLTGSLGGLTGGGNPLSAVNGLQGQLQGQLAALGLGGLGLGGGALNGLSNSANGLLGTATGATSGLGLGNIVNGLPVGNGAMSSVTDTERQAEAQIQNNQSPLGILSDPMAVQKMIISQAQEIAHLEKLLQQQTQQAAVAASSRYPVSVANLPMDIPTGAVGSNGPIPGMSDTTAAVGENEGIFDSGLYNNRLAAPVTSPRSTEDGGALPDQPQSTMEVPSPNGEDDMLPASADPANTLATHATDASAPSSSPTTSAPNPSIPQENEETYMTPTGPSPTMATSAETAGAVMSSTQSDAGEAEQTTIAPTVMKRLSKARRDTSDGDADEVPGALDQTGSALDVLASSASSTVHRYVQAYQDPAQDHSDESVPVATSGAAVVTGMQRVSPPGPQFLVDDKGVYAYSRAPPLVRRTVFLVETKRSEAKGGFWKRMRQGLKRRVRRSPQEDDPVPEEAEGAEEAIDPDAVEKPEEASQPAPPSLSVAVEDNNEYVAPDAENGEAAHYPNTNFCSAALVGW